MASSRRPVAEGLFTWPPDELSLIGGRCAACSAWAFPLPTACPRCGATDMEERLLARHGTLWSWTSQGFPPKSPYNGSFSPEEPFVPWLVGLVELPGQLRLETVLVDCDQDAVEIGMPLTLVATPLRTDDDGTEIVTFAFTPDQSVPQQPTKEPADA